MRYPIRRLIQPDTECLVRELDGIDPDPHVANYFLVRRGDGQFALADHFTEVGPGDTVVIYNIAVLEPGGIEASNHLFNETHYARDKYVDSQGLWPDEWPVIDEVVPSDGSHVLEVCAGNGRVTTHLLRGANHVWGLDISPRSVKIAQRGASARLHFLVGDVRALPFPADTFAVVLCMENSLGNIFTDQLGALREMVRVCAPGGKVVLGFRHDPRNPNDAYLYVSRAGYLELGQTFSAARAQALLDDLGRACPEVQGLANRPGGPRSWGGYTYYALLDIA